MIILGAGYRRAWLATPDVDMELALVEPVVITTSPLQITLGRGYQVG